MSVFDVVEGFGQNSFVVLSVDGCSEDNLRCNGQLFVVFWIVLFWEGYYFEFNSWMGCWGLVGRGWVGIGVGVGVG